MQIMISLTYIVLAALVGVIVDVLLKKRIRRLVRHIAIWLDAHVPRLKHWLDGARLSRVTDSLRVFLTLAGLLTVLYLLAFGILISLDGTLTIDVPQQNIYVLDGQEGEARIVVLDKSVRGSLLNTFFPPADLMQVKITAKQGQVTVLDTINSKPSHEVTLKAHHQQAVTLRYSLAPGYQVGHVEVSVFGLWDDPKTDTAEAIKMIQFVIVRR